MYTATAVGSFNIKSRTIAISIKIESLGNGRKVPLNASRVPIKLALSCHFPLLIISFRSTLEVEGANQHTDQQPCTAYQESKAEVGKS